MIGMLLLAFSKNLFAQQPSRVMVSREHGHFTAHMDNRFTVVAQQEGPVSVNQLTATMQVGDMNAYPLDVKKQNTAFIIHPDTVGVITIEIDLGDTIETKKIRVKPVEAEARLGRWSAQTDEPVSNAEFKAQLGITALVQGFDIDARCRVYGYEVIRVNMLNQASRIKNKGSRYTEDTRALINQAVPRDLYIFRNIRCRCPGSSKIQRLEDMVFEIR
jgi:hypothetical protein